MDKFVLVCCEESQAVCSAFRRAGFIAFSNDLQVCSGGHPEWHIVKDSILLLDQFERHGFYSFVTEDGKYHEINRWDLIIAHPPCTYLSKAGACHFYLEGGAFNEARFQLGLAAREFFMYFYNYKHCSRVCIENPVAMGFYNLPGYSQIINPFDFGHPYMKRTCLWLRGLPPLFATSIFARDLLVSTDKADWYQKGGGIQRQINRSKTFTGIAEAMANQWGSII